jgi:hypothetical protein
VHGTQHPLTHRPSEEMVKMVLSRPCHPDDQFTTSILRHWCMKHDELLAEHIKSLLIKNNSLPRKRQRWDVLFPTHCQQASAGQSDPTQGSSQPSLWMTSSGLKICGMQDHCGLCCLSAVAHLP